MIDQFAAVQGVGLSHVLHLRGVFSLQSCVPITGSQAYASITLLASPNSSFCVLVCQYLSLALNFLLQVESDHQSEPEIRDLEIKTGKQDKYLACITSKTIQQLILSGTPN